MKAGRFFSALLFILILSSTISCSRPTLIVRIESESNQLIDTPEGSPETVRIKTNAIITPFFADTAGNGNGGVSG